MKCTIMLVLAACLQVSARSYSQIISVDLREVTMEKALKEIGRQSGYHVFYKQDQLKNANGPVSIRADKKDVRLVLDELFKFQPLQYHITNETIVISLKEDKKDAAALTGGEIPGYGAPPTHDISGKITDEDGNPLGGASINVKGSPLGTQANPEGIFILKGVQETATIEFRYVGYETLSLPVGTRTSFIVSLKLKAASLEEVIVNKGYYSEKMRNTVGNVAIVTSRDIEKQPVTNVLQALQGTMPGVFVTQANGLPGAGITVQIRGAGSLGSANRPLYIIDGVPFLSEPITSTISGVVALSAEGATSPMNIINPSDIERIEVLKDADATAIYGSRGANGVVLITTKKGKSGKTQFTVNASTGTSKVAHFIDLLNTQQYLALRRKGFANNPTVVPGPGDVDLSWDTSAYTNFPKMLLGNTAHAHDLTASVSGGDARTNFYLSGTYHKETNIFPGKQGYIRGGSNLNLNHSSMDQRFTISLSAVYSADKNDISTTDLANYAYFLAPNFPLYKPDGTLYWASGYNNPLGYLNQTNDARGSNFLTNVNLKYTILKGLDIKASVGYSKTDMKLKTIRPLSSINATSTTTSGSANESYTYVNNYIYEPQLSYHRPIWKGVFDVLAGWSWQFKQSAQPYSVSATDFLSDDFITNLNTANTRVFSSSSADFKYTSLFGRLNYIVDDKYIANISFRRDGSSKFGENKRFGNFGSAGAAWIFSEERLLKDHLKWLSFGKLRGSYGVIGNDDIGNNRYYDSYTTTTVLYNGLPALQPSRLANKDFQWEETRKVELGLEMGFLKDKLSFTASVYRNRTSNQLLLFAVSPQAGFSNYQSNLPALVQNSGVEFTLNSTNFRNKSLTWTTSFNISKNNNRLVSFPDIEKTNYYGIFQVGKPINTSYLYNYTGIDQSTGLPGFTDFNGDGIIGTGFAATGRGDQYNVGTIYPSYYGGMTNAVTYKGLKLEFTFQFVKQKGRSLTAYSYAPPGYPVNAAASVINKYLGLGSKDQMVTSVTSTVNGRAAYFAFLYYAASDATFTDASFIRMKNVSLSYSLPKKWASKIKAQNFKIYVQGQNLFTITGYEGYDPESQGIGTPPLRTIVAGLQCTF